MVVKTTVDPSALVSDVRVAVHEIDPDQPLYDVRPMTAVVESTLRAEWLTTVMMGAFGLMALTLAAGGLYGVISYLTAERRREFGIRLALGATTSDVLTLVLRQALGRAVAGLALGLALAAAGAQALGSMLHGVGVWDPLIYSTVSGLLIVVVLTACFVPAWAASRLDPRNAIQQE